MRFESYRFGSIQVDGTTYEHDVIVERGRVRKRKKGPSKKLRAAYGHTPLSAEEVLPWRCRRMVIGTGAIGALPVTAEVQDEARRRGIELVILPTPEALEVLRDDETETNAVLHVTC